MTTRQTPDAVREAVAKALYNFRPGCGWKTVKGRPASYAIPWDEACEAHKADAYQEADAALAALDSRAGDAREGWKLVPVEPTEAMLDAYWKQTGESKEMRSRTHAYMRRYWSAMLAATPAPAVDAQEGDDEGPCTDCEDTGITTQTERACSCEAGDQYRAPAVDAVPAGEMERLREAAAKVLYDSWSDQTGWVPWVERGNSIMQERARREVML